MWAIQHSGCVSPTLILQSPGVQYFLDHDLHSLQQTWRITQFSFRHPLLLILNYMTLKVKAGLLAATGPAWDVELQYWIAQAKAVVPNLPEWYWEDLHWDFFDVLEEAQHPAMAERTNLRK